MPSPLPPPLPPAGPVPPLPPYSPVPPEFAAPAGDADVPSTRYPIVHGCLLGGAIGDALGAPVESLSLNEIRQKYGPCGVGGEDSFAFDGSISEETQLALLTLDARLRAFVRSRERGIGGALTGITQETYIQWLIRQGELFPKQQWAIGGWLAGDSAINSPRGTSRTVIAAMRRAQSGNPLGTRAEPINDSKGSAAVVRVAASGFGYQLSAAFESGCDIAALTHGHPSGWLAAGTFAALVFGLYQQMSLREALAHAQDELRRQRHHEEVSGALTDAITLADKGSPTAESLESLGRGWTAPEALAMAVYAALTADAAGGREPEIVRRGLLLAVNHSGDSDATGALCGSLLGARYGVQGLPPAWADRIEAADTIYQLARDYCVETGPRPPGDGYGGVARYWSTRYMA